MSVACPVIDVATLQRNLHNLNKCEEGGVFSIGLVSSMQSTVAG